MTQAWHLHNRHQAHWSTKRLAFASHFHSHSSTSTNRQFATGRGWSYGKAAQLQVHHPRNVHQSKRCRRRLEPVCHCHRSLCIVATLLLSSHIQSSPRKAPKLSGACQDNLMSFCLRSNPLCGSGSQCHKSWSKGSTSQEAKYNPVFRNKPGKWSTKPLLLHMHLALDKLRCAAACPLHSHLSTRSKAPVSTLECSEDFHPKIRWQCI
mmetsp:Transcript_17874/g.41452  ORF Transcript_17874/g.41452 Transcript_17874/m.41452 type:complete len:208 (+) Transcript_17874:3069-3692(+)